MINAKIVTATAAIGLLMSVSGCDLQTRLGASAAGNSSASQSAPSATGGGSPGGSNNVDTSNGSTASPAKKKGLQTTGKAGTSTSATANSGTTKTISGSNQNKTDRTSNSKNSLQGKGAFSSAASSRAPASTNSSLARQTSSSADTALTAIESDLVKHDSRFSVQMFNTAELGSLLKKAFAAEPYMHWIISNYDWNSQGTVSVKYRETKAQTSYVNAHAKEIVNQIIKPGMTGFEKEKVIHDWIVRHVQYDKSLQKYTAYDALNTGSAVCQGYALLAYKMLTDAGIRTKFVSGAAGGESHLWNEVYIDGNWYQLDVTWDDPVGASSSAVSYQYFNLTNQQLSATHQWSKNSVPVAAENFVTKLHALLTSDPGHAEQYKGLLAAVGGNLPTASTPASLNEFLTKAINARMVSYSIRIKASQSNAVPFIQQAFKNLHVNASVSTRYSYAEDARRGSGYSDVNFTFKYK